MALKEKALKRLTEKLTAAGVDFTLGASWLLCQHGILDVYHDFDVVVPAEQAEQADKVLSRLGMRSEAETRDGCFHASYHFDGADVDLCGGLFFAEYGLRAVLNQESAAEKRSVLGAEVPLGHLEDWLVWYALMGRESRFEAILTHLQSQPDVQRERFTACVDGPLPEALRARLAGFNG